MVRVGSHHGARGTDMPRRVRVEPPTGDPDVDMRVRRLNAPVGNPRKFTKPELRKALRASAGIRAAAAQILGVRGSTVTRAMQRWPDLLDVEEQERTKIAETALAKLVVGVHKGEPWAIALALKYTGSRIGLTPLSDTRVSAVVHHQHRVTISPEVVRQLSDDALHRILDGDFRALPAGTLDGVSGPVTIDIGEPASQTH